MPQAYPDVTAIKVPLSIFFFFTCLPIFFLVLSSLGSLARILADVFDYFLVIDGLLGAVNLLDLLQVVTGVAIVAVSVDVAFVV